MTSSPKKILIAGYYGFKNVGDEAILSAMLSSLRAIRTELEFVVVSGTPDETAAQHGVESILWTDLLEILEATRQSDLLILGGGGIFLDYWGVNADTLLTQQHAANSYFSGFPLLAELSGKPCMVYSVGVGPLFSESGRSLTRMAFELADVATVRDDESRKLAEAIGIESGKIQVSIDPAFGLQINQRNGVEALARAGVSPGCPVIGVCLRNWDINVSSDVWQKQVAGALDQFVETHNASLAFVPFQNLSENHLTNDLLVAEKVVVLMRNGNAASIITSTNAPEDIAGILAQCDLVVGMRLHSLIFGLKEAVPCVGISYDPKVKNTMIRADMAEYAVELLTLTSERLYGAMYRAWTSRTQIRAQLKGKMEELTKLAFQSAHLAIQLLDGSSQSKVKPAAVTYIKRFALTQVQRLAETEVVVQTLTQSVQGLSVEIERQKALIETQEALHAISLDKIKTQLAAKGAEIENTQTRLTAKEAELENTTTRLTAKEAELENTTTRLTAKEAELENTQTRLTAKEAELENTTTRLTAKEAELENTTTRLTAKEAELENTTTRLTAKEAEFDSAKIRLAAIDLELYKIRSSLGWRLLGRYGRIKHRYILPIYRLLRPVQNRFRVNRQPKP